ncbi:hypothetical protein [Halorussus halophilus]|uniref:hypothetical protein n=1 Tax=Halorussus halophilus TaxID=2650975 RepID=UPI00130153AC|nr:hypothetical protein [Halorussus halophilus]
MASLGDAFAAALDGPDEESRYECGHCGVVADSWHDDCNRCGGTMMRIVTEPREDEIERYD